MSEARPAVRIGSLLVGALVVSLLATLSLALPASAEVGAASVAQPSPTQAKALPKRNLHDKLVQKPRGLFIKGNVSPGWGNKPVVILKAKCKACAFKRVDRVRTNQAGKWSYKLSAPARGNWFWKGFVKKSGGYGRSETNLIYKTWR